MYVVIALGKSVLKVNMQMFVYTFKNLVPKVLGIPR